MGKRFPLVLLQAKAVSKIMTENNESKPIYKVSISSPSGEGGENFLLEKGLDPSRGFPLVLLQAKAVSPRRTSLAAQEVPPSGGFPLVLLQAKAVSPSAP